MFKRKSILMAMLCILLTLCISCSNNSKLVDLDLIPVQSSDWKWGYVNQKGEYVINPQFEDADFFRDGLARVVSSEGKVGFIDKNGKYVVEPKFKDATVFSEGLAFVVPDGGYPVCIDKHGDTNFQFKFGESVWRFSDGLAAFEIKSGKEGFIDKTGKIVINPQFDEVRYFSEGLAAVRQDHLWGFIDKTGTIVIEPQFLVVSDFKDGRAFCIPKGKFYVIYSGSNDIRHYNYGCINTKGHHVLGFDEDVYRVSDGMAEIKSDEKYGFISSDGKIKINPQYDFVLSFSEGLAAIEQSNLWGFINRQGEIVINPQFDAVRSFSDGLAAVDQGNRWGFIDKTGKIVINPEFNGVGSCLGNIAFVESAGKWGFIVMDKKGKYLVNPQFRGIKTESDYNIIEACSVNSDWYDSQLFVSKFFEKAKDDTFDGFSINSTLQSIVDNRLYGDGIEVGENKCIASCDREQEITDGISIKGVTFYFEHPIIHSDYGYRFSEKIAMLRYDFAFDYWSSEAGNEAIDKIGAIAHALKTEIENRYGVKMKSEGDGDGFGRYSVFSDSGFSFVVEFEESAPRVYQRCLTLYVVFNRKAFQDKKWIKYVPD